MTASMTPVIQVEILHDEPLIERLFVWSTVNDVRPIPGSEKAGVRSYTAYYWASASDALNEFFASPPVMANPECPACNGAGIVPICTHEPPCVDELAEFTDGKNEMPCLCVLKQYAQRRTPKQPA